MRSKIVVLLLAVSIALQAGATDRTRTFREAVNLFEHGLYERARTLFMTLGDDPVAEGYAVLCAGRTASPGFFNLLEEYDRKYPGSSFHHDLHYQAALNRFDNLEYAQAASEFARVDRSKLWKSEQSQYVFKYGYSEFELGDYPEAKTLFKTLETMPVCDYTPAARYALGVMYYEEQDFDEALKWFEFSVSDPRFEELSKFYMVDCHFMNRDYKYVTIEGVKLYDNIPHSRQIHLSRIISESFLVLGDKESALEYYSRDAEEREKKSDSDFFYAGSLMYFAQNYEAAIENYTRMRNRSDSLGQIASYQLANSYIKVHDKVSALRAFEDAAIPSYDQDIKEDAFFNQAKLAFDLNADGSLFEKYLQKYSTTRKGDQIYSYMALSRLVNRDYAGSIEAYDKIASPTPEQDRNYLKANYLRASQLISAGAYADALPYLKSATLGLSQHDPFGQLSRYWTAECKYRTGDYRGAQTEYTNLYNISALDNKAEGRMLPYNIAYSAFMDGNYQTAAKWFDRYIGSATYGLKQDALDRRGDCDFALHDFDAAIESYGAAVQASKSVNHIYPYYRQAICYGLVDNRKMKAETLEKVLKANPGAALYSQAVYELGRTYLDLKKNDRAIDIFNLLLENSKDINYQAKALIGQGMANLNLSRSDEALRCYKRVVSDMPQTEDAQNALLAIESIYQGMNDTAGYLKYLDESGLNSTKSDEDREKLYFTAAEQNYLAENYADAEKSLLKYIGDYPDGIFCGAAWFYLGECYRQEGDKEAAVQAYGKSIGLVKQDSFKENALLYFASLSESLEHFTEAYQAYAQLESVTRFDENRQKAEAGRVRCAYGARDYAKAVEDASAAAASDENVYYKAKSLLALSRRDEAMAELGKLAGKPSTEWGAEANYLLIQDAFNRGRFQEVSDKVYDFAPKASGQDYWLARAFIVLGDSFAEQGNPKQARTTYESILDGYVPATQTDDIRAIVEERISRLDK